MIPIDTRASRLIESSHLLWILVVSAVVFDVEFRFRPVQIAHEVVLAGNAPFPPAQVDAMVEQRLLQAVTSHSVRQREKHRQDRLAR
ncbi:MAG: hypothetical protein ACLR3C_09690 [Eggerthella lenta]